MGNHRKSATNAEAAIARHEDAKAVCAAADLARLQEMDDWEYELRPEGDRQTADLLHTLLEDEGVSKEAAARAIGQPAAFVAHYRDAVGI